MKNAKKNASTEAPAEIKESTPKGETLPRKYTREEVARFTEIDLHSAISFLKIILENPQVKELVIDVLHQVVSKKEG